MTDEQRKQCFDIRKCLDVLVAKIAESPAEVNENMAAIQIWKPGTYVVGDVRRYNGNPYKCVQAHDSTMNPHWTPENLAALWMQYHGTTKDTARPWITPLGTEDRYRVGEWMIWTDGLYYFCKSDTTYSPVDYPAAWDKYE